MKTRLFVKTGFALGMAAGLAYTQEPPPDLLEGLALPAIATVRIDSESLAREIAKAASTLDRVQPILMRTQIGDLQENVALALAFAADFDAQEGSDARSTRDRDVEHAARDAERAARDAARDVERAQHSIQRDRERDEHAYRKGQYHLDKRDYPAAVDSFNEVIEQKSSRAEGALYWRAYAQNKMGKRNEALASLAELKKNYPNGRWLEDSKALEVEVRQASGAPVSPENTTDEDMKLLVLNGLVDSDPERTMPLLEKILKGTQSPKVKERALFVLAQTHSQKGREIVAQVAKGNYNPDLQAKAIEYLSVFGGRESAPVLADIYKNTKDLQIKRSILHGFMISGSRDAVLAVARSESNPELRVDAIHQLAAMGGSAELLQLYAPDAPLEVKKAVLQGLFMQGQADKILEIARNDKDINMRREAIRQLGPMGGRKSADGLIALYAKETDQANKREILNGLFIQGNAAGLIEIAKKETDPNLKREAVQKLSIMHTKEATDFLVDLLNK